MTPPVVVPDSLREPIWQALAGEIRRRRITDGQTSVRPDLLVFLEQLRRGEQDPDAEGSASGSAVAGTGIVWLTTGDMAKSLGCTERHARTIAAEIGTRTGRQWLVEEQTFNNWRRNRT